LLHTYSLSGLTMVSSAGVLPERTLKVENRRIRALGDTAKHEVRFAAGLFCYPALLNVHDHLRGNYLPRIGPTNGAYYLNWSYWENDLRASAVVLDERANIPVEQMYQLSAYKNLFSGVVTVNDHFPHEFNEPFIPGLPMRVIRDYTLAHECSSFDLKWGDGIQVEHRRAVERNHPFITHLEEGFDAESQDGVGILERLGCLDDHGVFIHCIGFSDEDQVRFPQLLLGEKNSVLAEYRERARKEVNRAFLYAYEDQAQALFDNYMKHATAFCLRRKLVDPVTREEQEPDEKLMRSIEEMIGIPEGAKSEFRQGLFVFKSDALERGDSFDFKNYPPLQEAIEKKLIADLKNIVSLTLADRSRRDPKTAERKQEAVAKLLDRGYCPLCAEALLEFVGEMLRKEE